MPALRARASDRQRRAGALRPAAQIRIPPFSFDSSPPECRNSRRERGIRRRPSLRAKANSSGKPNRSWFCALASGEYEPKVRADFLGGVRSGVNGTPSFFINGERHDGSYAFDDLVAAIELRLRRRAAL
jgi:Thioredoxin